MTKILHLLRSVAEYWFLEVHMLDLLCGLRSKKTGNGCSSFLTAGLHKRWLPVLLAFFVVSELCLPDPGRAQSFADTGLFYFTGAHTPRRNVLFRDFQSGYAEPGSELKVGPFLLHPFLGVAEVFTDNVFRRDKDRRSDFLTTIAPGLQALLPFGGGRHSFLLDYRAGQFLYNKFSENNALTQEAQGQVSLKFPGGLEVDLQGGHIAGFDPRGSELDIQNEEITKWNINEFESRFEFSGPNAGIRFRTSYLDLHYKNNDQAPRRDRVRLRADLTFLADVTASTSALLGVQIADNTFDKNTQLNSFQYSVFTGFKMAPTRLLSGEFNIGYSVLNFDRAPLPEPPASGLSAGGKQQTAVFMRGNLFWRPTSRLSFSANTFRFISQGAVFNTSTFITTGITIQGRHALTDRLGYRGAFSYFNDDFDSGRKDNRFRWRMGPEFRAVRWLGFRLDYIFEKRYSNESNFDYYSNTIMFSIQAFL